jgi:hypothetical protein
MPTVIQSRTCDKLQIEEDIGTEAKKVSDIRLFYMILASFEGLSS